MLYRVILSMKEITRWTKSVNEKWGAFLLCVDRIFSNSQFGNFMEGQASHLSLRWLCSLILVRQARRLSLHCES